MYLKNNFIFLSANKYLLNFLLGISLPAYLLQSDFELRLLTRISEPCNKWQILLLEGLEVKQISIYKV